MKRMPAIVGAICLVASRAVAAEPTTQGARPMTSIEDVRAVAPALENYRNTVVLGDLWKREGLSPRDRSMVTLAALIARSQTVELADYLNLALDNGVRPGEISEIITHLAFYTGWANAMAAANPANATVRARRATALLQRFQVLHNRFGVVGQNCDAYVSHAAGRARARR